MKLNETLLVLAGLFGVQGNFNIFCETTCPPPSKGPLQMHLPSLHNSPKMVNICQALGSPT